ncbi:protein FAR1-RELATED SEQUENCE 9-like [Spinacia oleracea]|uniref:Protein FAR1-RELATED SEQUENCE 9-like n=1 Tax=Spinacia oleracea TaxID=3562 RepID=A0ABM3QR28_SPIOL|nr:protein FAR1-RELATED SEQUENCE 9-like [Spinacia oleracea]
MINSGVSPAVTMRNLVQQAGGPDKLPFLKKDLYNACQRISKEDIPDGDTEAVAFGNVNSFDTTYKVNAYHKPLVVIVGVNHHSQSVVFVVSLVSHEKEETFKWILEQLTKVGDNVAPQTVLIDGDKSSKTFCSGFMICVDRCRTPTEFEQAWKELITTYGYEKEVWAQGLYNDKEKWAEYFMHGHFFGGMRMLKDIRFTEAGLDYQTKHTTLIIKGVLSSVKTHAATVYPRNSYDMLCKEMNYESSHIFVKFKQDKTHLDGVTNIYWLSNTKYRKVQYIVIHSVKFHKMYCCCMKLESVGIPCRHMFAVMKYGRMTEIPRGYILRRWTKYAKAGLSYGHTLEEFKEQTDTAFVGRFAYLNGLGIQICRLATRSYNGSLWLKNFFSKVLISLETHDEKAEGILRKATLVRIGDPKVLQADMGLKKKASKPQEKSNSPEKPKSIDLN